MQITYEMFVADAEAEASVVTALVDYRTLREKQNQTRILSAPLMALLESPDVRELWAHASEVVDEHFVMLHAAEVNCVPLFRLAIEGLGVRRWARFGHGLEFFVHIAARLGRPGVMRYLLSQGADPNTMRANGRNEAIAPLWWAIQSRNSETVAALLEAPAIDTSRVNSRGTTAMDCAIGLRQIDAVRLLLDHGVALSDDAIVRAMGSYRPELVTVVAAHVDDWNFTGKKTGITPLQSAIVAQHGPTVRLLLDAGADPDFPSRKKYRKKFPGKSSARDFAAQVGDADILAML